MLFVITIIPSSLLDSKVWLANHFCHLEFVRFAFKISGTWIWLLTGYFMGYQIDLYLIRYVDGWLGGWFSLQLGEKLDHGKSLILWKTLYLFRLVLSWPLKASYSKRMVSIFS